MMIRSLEDLSCGKRAQRSEPHVLRNSLKESPEDHISLYYILENISSNATLSGLILTAVVRVASNSRCSLARKVCDLSPIQASSVSPQIRS